MQTVTSMEQIAALADNFIVGNFTFMNSKVIFKGKGNILITTNAENSESVILDNTTIIFNNDNSVVFLNESKSKYSVAISLYNNNFCYIGANNYFNGRLNIHSSEQCNIFIADDCIFSLGVWLRNSDAHLIYDAENHKRINSSKSIFIGDHVWIGQDARIWKGTQIGSGAILGASAFCAGKRIPSNTSWGGNPARLIKRGVFFYGIICTHSFTDKMIEQWREYSDDEYIYAFDANETLDFLELERKIQTFSTAREVAEFLLDFSKRKAKNRFYIESHCCPAKE